jgi:anaerobic dimethyl sulfoxide reductase subunit B (iron-sulfur subunit)
MGFYFDQTRCIGCFTCIVACKDWNDVDAGPASWRRVITVEKGSYPDLFVAFLSTTCCHCSEPACVAACPADAITKRELDGVVVIEQEACLGKDNCHMCLDACPYDAPQFGAEKNAKMEKCHFCLDLLAENKKPACVDACPMRAMDAGPMEELGARYGDVREAEGFSYSAKLNPSTVFKSKKDAEALTVQKSNTAPLPR